MCLLFFWLFNIIQGFNSLVFFSESVYTKYFTLGKCKNNLTYLEKAMSRTISQVAVAEYSTKLIDKELLQKKLIEYRRLLEEK